MDGGIVAFRVGVPSDGARDIGGGVVGTRGRDGHFEHIEGDGERRDGGEDIVDGDEHAADAVVGLLDDPELTALGETRLGQTRDEVGGAHGVVAHACV